MLLVRLEIHAQMPWMLAWETPDSKCSQLATPVHPYMKNRLWRNYNTEKGAPSILHGLIPSCPARARSAIPSWRIHTWQKMCLAFYPSFLPSLSVGGVMGVETHLNMSSWKNIIRKINWKMPIIQFCARYKWLPAHGSTYPLTWRVGRHLWSETLIGTVPKEPSCWYFLKAG